MADIKYKNSKQRKKILELLSGTDTHPTATWIYDRLKKDFPNLSLGTVYRNLNILIAQGLARKIDFGSTFDRYDANITTHYHFICEKCHAIIDLDIHVDKNLEKKVDQAMHFKTKKHRIEFFGLCDKCLANKKSR
ncbi:MAG: transcriptional repressor [Spirochaetes bacterium]|nr:transcriptional repressor [Spirochaetota bacterium]